MKRKVLYLRETSYEHKSVDSRWAQVAHVILDFNLTLSRQKINLLFPLKNRETSYPSATPGTLISYTPFTHTQMVKVKGLVLLQGYVNPTDQIVWSRYPSLLFTVKR